MIDWTLYFYNVFAVCFLCSIRDRSCWWTGKGEVYSSANQWVGLCCCAPLLLLTAL